MKRIILLCALVAGSVMADTVAVSKNSAGGLIVLTDIPCDGMGFYAYASSNQTSTLFGCWSSDQTMVHIIWKDNDVRSYPLTNWTINGEVADRLKARIRNGGV